MHDISTLQENYGRFEDDDRSWDVAFWQRQGSAAIFDAVWGMILDQRLLTKRDATEPRLQRTVEHFGEVHFIGRDDLIAVKKASGRDQDLRDVDALRRGTEHEQ